MIHRSGFFTFKLTITLLAVLLALPTLIVFGAWFVPKLTVWQHLADTVLNQYVSNTLVLAFGVGLSCALLGTFSAWCVSQYRFPGRHWFTWMLLLPIAFPPYIMAYTYTGILEFSGPVQSAIRSLFSVNYGDYWFPDIQSMWGAILVMSLVLFPYVYGLAYVAFSAQSKNYYLVAKNHGYTDFHYFVKIALPLALPAITAGSLLAMMEAFADFGTVEYMGVATFTTGVFRTWFGMNEPVVAAQLSAALVSFVLFLMFLEKWTRRKQRYFQNDTIVNEPRVLGQRGQWFISTSLGLLVLVAFLIPVVQLLYWVQLVLRTANDIQLGQLLANSFMVALIAAIVVLVVALLFGYFCRKLAISKLVYLVKTASLGYAFPGAVIAVGAVIGLGAADRWINDVSIALFDTRLGLIFSGTLFALIFAYTVRYLTVGMQYVNTGLQRIPPTLDQAAQVLGSRPFATMRKIHAPLLSNSLLVGGLMVFVDVLKELPATLILRPFNFDTLAVKTYELASDERLTDAALPALVIVMTGLLPVWFIQQNISKKS